MNDANQRYWDAMAPDWEKLRDQDQLWRNLPRQPELAFDGEALPLIRRYVGDLKGRQALVLASGDNYVTFALAGMGARVTSTDISAQQLEIARRRAEMLGLEITFVRADATVLAGIAGGMFDLVCSSNGFFVWIADPGRVFAQAHRVLKPGGYYVFYDVHPFQRPWADQVSPLEMEKPYTATGPFQYEEKGQENFQFNWRMSDLVNPLLNSGLLLRQVAESMARDARFWEGSSYSPAADSHLNDWRSNPRAGLPVWLSVAAQKPE
jgi:ubiquinone/menaquinone biosynthesis C-methylase UbiE